MTRDDDGELQVLRDGEGGNSLWPIDLESQRDQGGGLAGCGEGITLKDLTLCGVSRL